MYTLCCSTTTRWGRGNMLYCGGCFEQISLDSHGLNHKTVKRIHKVRFIFRRCTSVSISECFSCHQSCAMLCTAYAWPVICLWCVTDPIRVTEKESAATLVLCNPCFWTETSSRDFLAIFGYFWLLLATFRLILTIFDYFWLLFGYFLATFGSFCLLFGYFWLLFASLSLSMLSQLSSTVRLLTSSPTEYDNWR